MQQLYILGINVLQLYEYEYSMLKSEATTVLAHLFLIFIDVLMCGGLQGLKIFHKRIDNL